MLLFLILLFIIALIKDDENIQPLFVFSPPNTRSSAKKKQNENKISGKYCFYLISGKKISIRVIFNNSCEI